MKELCSVNTTGDETTIAEFKTVEEALASILQLIPGKIQFTHNTLWIDREDGKTFILYT